METAIACAPHYTIPLRWGHTLTNTYSKTRISAHRSGKKILCTYPGFTLSGFFRADMVSSSRSYNSSFTQNAQTTTVIWHSADWQALWLMLILFRYTTYRTGTGLWVTLGWAISVHLSGYNCIQKLHMGLAKHVHLSGFKSCTKHRAKVRGMENVCTYLGFTV